MDFRKRDESLRTGQGRVSERSQALRSGLVAEDLRKPRSARLVDTIAKLDVGLDEQACQQVAAWIAREYTRQPAAAVPLGLVAACRLGPPYVDHLMSLAEIILDHYTAADRIPEPFAAARPLARSEAYAYVEVYSDGLLVPVRRDGTVVVP